MRLIDADALKRHYAWWKGGTREMTMDEAKGDFDVIIDLQPTIEQTATAKKATWRYIRDEEANGLYECTACHHGDIHAKEVRVPFCWFCGARMDAQEEPAP